jgi:hypothetical protein
LKKITVIGRGTVGCLAVAHFYKWTDWQIDWVYDPTIEPASVGEGTNLIFPIALGLTLNFDSKDLDAIDSHVKMGIWKRNWSKDGGDFKHTFLSGSVGMHFNANRFQQYVFNILSKKKRVSCIESNSTDVSQIDSDYIMVCTGTPKTLDDDFNIRTSIPVNSCVVFQCPWELPKFDYSLTFAQSQGWAFGIPLKNRCSIGYLYNKDFVADEKDLFPEAHELLNEFSLTPAQTRTLSFKNYTKKINFEGRVCYNGNASFFLEPLEATSTGFADMINRIASDLWSGAITHDNANNFYNRTLTDIESMILLHYLAGSKYHTPFWEFAQKKAEERMKIEFKEDTNFSRCLLQGVFNKDEYLPAGQGIGSWNIRSYVQNIEGLKIKEKLIQIWNSI